HAFFRTQGCGPGRAGLVRCQPDDAGKRGSRLVLFECHTFLLTYVLERFYDCMTLCACMRVRSALSYCEPPLAGKMAPMSQRKGMKIPMIPNATYPFLKVSKHTVKRQTMYTVKSRDAKIKSSMVM